MKVLVIDDTALQFDGADIDVAKLTQVVDSMNSIIDRLTNRINQKFTNE